MSSIAAAYWVSGIATTAAVIVALWFSAQARVDARHQELHRVYAWAEYAPVLHATGHDDGWKVVFSNLTDIPVFVVGDAAHQIWARRPAGLLAKATATERALLGDAALPTDVSWTVWPGSHTP